MQEFNQMKKTCRSSAEIRRDDRRSQPRRPPKSAAKTAEVTWNSSRIPPEFLSNSTKTFPGFRSRIPPRFRSRLSLELDLGLGLILTLGLALGRPDSRLRSRPRSWPRSRPSSPFFFSSRFLLGVGAEPDSYQSPSRKIVFITSLCAGPQGPGGRVILVYFGSYRPG